jgi:hypothetical protein
VPTPGAWGFGGPTCPGDQEAGCDGEVPCEALTRQGNLSSAALLDREEVRICTNGADTDPIFGAEEVLFMPTGLEPTPLDDPQDLLAAAECSELSWPLARKCATICV